jgi:hypothetical protein
MPRCPQCGAEIGAGSSAAGVCAACLLKVGLAETGVTGAPVPWSDSVHLHFAPRGPLPEAGSRFGAYQLVRTLGRGGFGVVWEAEHVETGRRVALKMMTVLRATSSDALARFEREGRLAASVNHPRCVFVFGAEEIDGYPTIVMELMPGGTLQDEIDRRGPLAPTEAVDYVLDAMDGLEAAHGAGVIHRDVKPSNCFLDEHGRVKIGDFGISKTLEPQWNLTASGSFVGTPAYAAPEQVCGREVDFRSDIYALGATLYALLSGTPPFTGAGAGEVLARVLSEDPPRLVRRGLKLPRGLERVIRHMLAKEPGKRYRDYRSVRAALLPFSSQGLTPAGLGLRFAAYLVDTTILFVPSMVVGFSLASMGWYPRTSQS